MGMRTGVIRFNVKHRGRQHRGQDRNFDTVALAQLVNGPEVQERVKNGDMLGYFGHWPRLKFGMDVGEGGLVNGKVVHIEPAVRTISIKADQDGNIDHEAEFLDTAPGRLAARMHQSKSGGFSSAITAPRRGSLQVATAFHGFDFVNEPNYTGNRGYALDSVDFDSLEEHEKHLLDDVAQYNQLVDATNTVLDRVQDEYDLQAEVVTQLHEENVGLQSRIADLEKALDSARAEGRAEALEEVERQAKAAEPPAAMDTRTLDSAAVGALGMGESRFCDAESFRKAKLVQFEDGSEEKGPPTAADNYIAKRWGV